MDILAKTSVDEARDAKMKALRTKLARVRLARLEVQRKQWQVTEVKTKWFEKLQDIQLQRHLIAERRASISSLDSICLRQLDAMAQMHVPNDCFHIWHTGPYATINGFRLGRLSADQVEWVEINAALGQVALLLSTIQNESPVSFRSVDLFPRGSFSQIAKALSSSDIEKGTRQQLFNLYSDGSGFSIFSRTTSFAKALELLLNLISEMGSHIQATDPAFCLPYSLTFENGPKVGDTSIIFGQVSDELWTKALKMMLTDVKWVVAWAAKHVASSA